MRTLRRRDDGVGTGHWPLPVPCVTRASYAPTAFVYRLQPAVSATLGPWPTPQDLRTHTVWWWWHHNKCIYAPAKTA
eukprot:scaffold14336_cov63-Phaeocystis_antarctica.AAC.2